MDIRVINVGTGLGCHSSRVPEFQLLHPSITKDLEHPRLVLISKRKEIEFADTSVEVRFPDQALSSGEKDLGDLQHHEITGFAGFAISDQPLVFGHEVKKNLFVIVLRNDWKMKLSP